MRAGVLIETFHQATPDYHWFQAGPFVGAGNLEPEMHAMADEMKRRGYRWLRCTESRRYLVMEGWSGPKPPENLPAAPEPFRDVRMVSR